MNAEDEAPVRCACGAEYIPAVWKALTLGLTVVEIHGLSCPTYGCEGNLAQRWTTILNELESPK